MELYEEDLITITTILNKVEEIGHIEGVFGIEIRVRFDDTQWAVLGYGESGDPCLLRFE